MKKYALISDDKNYRYVLSRQWDESLPSTMFIGLNPSTADDKIDDPTVRRLINFTKDWGYGGFYLLNLFAYRSTNPEILLKVKDPIGLDNDKYLKEYSNKSDIIVFAWGTKGKLMNRSEIIKEMFSNGHCLKKNKSGEPSHPLYIPKDSKPIIYTQN